MDEKKIRELDRYWRSVQRQLDAERMIDEQKMRITARLLGLYEIRLSELENTGATASDLSSAISEYQKLCSTSQSNTSGLAKQVDILRRMMGDEVESEEHPRLEQGRAQTIADLYKVKLDKD